MDMKFFDSLRKDKIFSPNEKTLREDKMESYNYKKSRSVSRKPTPNCNFPIPNLNLKIDKIKISRKTCIYDQNLHLIQNIHDNIKDRERSRPPTQNNLNGRKNQIAYNPNSAKIVTQFNQKMNLNLPNSHNNNINFFSPINRNAIPVYNKYTGENVFPGDHVQDNAYTYNNFNGNGTNTNIFFVKKVSLIL
jgi:hypothetical protein